MANPETNGPDFDTAEEVALFAESGVPLAGVPAAIKAEVADVRTLLDTLPDRWENAPVADGLKQRMLALVQPPDLGA